MPADVLAKRLKSILNNKISKGDVNIGTFIVPQMFEKTSVKDGHLVTEEVKRWKLRGVKLNSGNTTKNVGHAEEIYVPAYWWWDWKYG